jgi:hypothetical protein
VLRWLLPLIAAMALLGSSVMSWAAAGFVENSSCCCPDKAKCKCHDHAGKPAPAPTMKRCNGDAQWVAPTVAPAVTSVQLPPATDVRVAAVATPFRAVVPVNRAIEVETPPF